MHVIISESQLKLFQELVESDSLFLDNGNVREKGDLSKVGTSATITDADGEPKNGKDVSTDDVSHELANQYWFGTYPLSRRA